MSGMVKDLMNDLEQGNRVEQVVSEAMKEPENKHPKRVGMFGGFRDIKQQMEMNILGAKAR